LTATSKYTLMYRVLRDRCGLTHFEVRHILKTHYGPLALHENLLKRESKRERDELHPVIEATALLANDKDAKDAATKLRGLVEGDDDLDYLICRQAAKQIRSWHPEWGEAERQEMERVLAWLRVKEQRRALREWKKRNLLTYLRVQGLNL
jgi:hypothetical protein